MAPLPPPAPNSERGASRWYALLDQSPLFAENADLLGQPAPTHDLQLDISFAPEFEVGSAPASVTPEVHLLMKLTPQGEPLVDPQAGPVAHVILALDVSASMNHPDKYPVLTQALERMLMEMQASQAGDVLLSVVLFAKGSEVLLRGLPISTIEPRSLLDLIDRSELRFGRYTDLSGALSRAGRIAYDYHRADRVTPIRIYALTDGKPQDVDRARSVMQKLSRLPVDVDALAFGSDADVAILQQIITGGRGGTVKHVRRDTLGDAFGRIGEVAQRVVAKRSLLSLELRRGVVGGAAYRFRPARHFFGTDAFEGGRTFHTDLGTLESGRSYSLLFQLRLPRTAYDETEIGRVVVRVPGYGGPRIYECPLALPRHSGEEMPDSSPLVVEAREVLEALDGDDVEGTLRALKTRRRIYEAERRDPYVLDLLDKAIQELEEAGTLESLSQGERAALLAHTCTAGSTGTASREFSAG